MLSDPVTEAYGLIHRHPQVKIFCSSRIENQIRHQFSEQVLHLKANWYEHGFKMFYDSSIMIRTLIYILSKVISDDLSFYPAKSPFIKEFEFSR